MFTRLHHTSIPMPSGGNDEARRFYGGVLGLHEVTPPSTLGSDRLVWFLIGDQGDELHLYVEQDFVPSSNGQHVCFVADDLAGVRSALEAEGIQIGVEPDILYRPRFSFRDPFGNKVEVTEIHGDYKLTEQEMT